jgi:hypothetical protein
MTIPLYSVYVDRLPSYLNDNSRQASFQLHLLGRPFLEETLLHEGNFYKVTAVVHVQFQPGHIFVRRLS